MITSSGGSSSKSKARSSPPSETSFNEDSFRKNHMMYGFGDGPNICSNSLWQLSHGLLDPQPLLESVALVEDIVLECITDLVHKAQDIGSKRGKLSVEDFLYLIRKDLPKLNCCTELLSMNEEPKQARKAFESDEEKLRKVFEADEKN